MKRSTILLASFILALAAFGAAQTVTYQYPAYADPCQNPAILKLGTPVHVTTATTTELVPVSTTKPNAIVYVCGYNLTSVGTGVITFKTGTKVSTACDTTPTSLTGSWLIPTATNQSTTGDRGVQFAGIAGGELCLTTASGVTSVDGYINYVQQ